MLAVLCSGAYHMILVSSYAILYVAGQLTEIIHDESFYEDDDSVDDSDC